MHPRLNERTEKPNGRRLNMPQARAKSAAVKVNPNRPKGKLNPPSKQKMPQAQFNAARPN